VTIEVTLTQYSKTRQVTFQATVTKCEVVSINDPDPGSVASYFYVIGETAFTQAIPLKTYTQTPACGYTMTYAGKEQGQSGLPAFIEFQTSPQQLHVESTLSTDANDSVQVYDLVQIVTLADAPAAGLQTFDDLEYQLTLYTLAEYCKDDELTMTDPIVDFTYYIGSGPSPAKQATFTHTKTICPITLTLSEQDNTGFD